MLMRGNIKYILWIALTLIMGYAIFLAFQNTEKEIKAKVLYCLNEAIDSDLMFRIQKMGGLVSPIRYPSEKYKSVYIITERGKETFHFKDSINAEIIDGLLEQYMLVKVCPIQPITLDSIFNCTLQKQNLSLRTAVSYTYKGVTQYSSNDLRFMAKAFHTPLHVVDIKKEIMVRGFADITTGVILERMKISLFILFGVWVIAITIICYVFRSSKIIKKEEEVREENSATDPDRIVLKNICVNISDETLYINGEEKKIYQSDYKLLLLFLNAPNYELSRKEIMDYFWSDKEDCENRLNTAISRLRSILKEDSGLELVNKRKTGYYLEVAEE